MSSLAINRQHLAHVLDGGVAARAAIGLIVLATDHTIEHEWRELLHPLPGVAFFESRIPNSATITPETLAEMEQHIAACTAVIRPGERIDAMAYGCTSGAMVMGAETVNARVHEARPGVPCTNPFTAGMVALEALGVRRVALLTPYIDEVNQWMRGEIVKQGLEVPVMGSFNLPVDNDVARISESSVEEALVELGSEDAVDGVFVSCTSLRVASIVERAEQRIGKPVTASNHAMAWHALRLAGVNDTIPGYGRLFRDH